MNRRTFIQQSALGIGGVLTTSVMGNNLLNSFTEKTAKMPVLYYGARQPDECN